MTGEDPTPATLLFAARRFVAARISIIPIGENKHPALTDGIHPLSWARYQQRHPSDAELRDWFSRPCGIGVVCGSVSRNILRSSSSLLTLANFSENIVAKILELKKQPRKNPNDPETLKKLLEERIARAYRVRHRGLPPRRGASDKARRVGGVNHQMNWNRPTYVNTSFAL